MSRRPRMPSEGGPPWSEHELSAERVIGDFRGAYGAAAWRRDHGEPTTPVEGRCPTCHVAVECGCACTVIDAEGDDVPDGYAISSVGPADTFIVTGPDGLNVFAKGRERAIGFCLGHRLARALG